jgi:hypothetical protein
MICPERSAGLRIKIENRGCQPHGFSGNGEMHGKRGFSGTALPADNCERFHGKTYVNLVTIYISRMISAILVTR